MTSVRAMFARTFQRTCAARHVERSRGVHHAVRDVACVALPSPTLPSPTRTSLWVTSSTPTSRNASREQSSVDGWLNDEIGVTR